MGAPVESDRHELDVIDRYIIDQLTRDARMAVRALAEHAHISRANAYARLDRLKRAGVIRGFTIRVSHDKVGLGTSAFVGLSITQNAWRGLFEHLTKLSFVDHFCLLGGDIDVLVLVRASDNKELRRVVLEELQSLHGVLSTRTWLIFEEADGPGTEIH